MTQLIIVGIYLALLLALGLFSLGTVEAGKLADILVLDEDPLAELRNSVAIRYVMKNGRLYDGDTLAEEWPRQLPGPNPHLAKLGAAGGSGGDTELANGRISDFRF